MHLAVHACCAPCTLDSLSHLPAGRALFIYDNPNIHPFREYRSRRDSFLGLAQAEGLEFEVLPYRPEDWIEAVSRSSARCEACYRLRLEAVARHAGKRGCSALTTTLLASPFQDHDLLNSTGQAAAAASGLEWFAWDGSAGYREAVKAARDRGIYIQSWCGCILSERDRYDRSRRHAD